MKSAITYFARGKLRIVVFIRLMSCTTLRKEIAV